MPEEKKTPFAKRFVKYFDNLFFGWQVEVYYNVTAKNYIHFPEQLYPVFIKEVQMTDGNHPLDFIV
jgi:hypothetical protein